MIQVIIPECMQLPADWVMQGMYPGIAPMLIQIVLTQAGALYAFEQAVCSGNPGNWNYINGVLARLAQRNITTLAAAEAYDEDRYR